VKQITTIRKSPIKKRQKKRVRQREKQMAIIAKPKP